MPVIQAGFVIFARKGMAPAVRVRETQLSDAGARRANVQRDMCEVWTGTVTVMQSFSALDRRQEPRVSATRRGGEGPGEGA